MRIQCGTILKAVGVLMAVNTHLTATFTPVADEGLKAPRSVSGHST